MRRAHDQTSWTLPAATGLTEVAAQGEGVLIADHGLVVVQANDEAAELLGWGSPAELVRGARASEWSIVDDEQAAEVLTALAGPGRWMGTALLEKRDGTMFDAALTACRLLAGDDDDDGSACSAIFTVRPLAATPFEGHVPTPDDSFEVEGLPGRFCLYFQPEFDLADHSIPSCEALLRWWHPDFGILSPGPSLDRTKWAELLAGVEAWSVLAVCEQVATWESERRSLQVAINVSRHHLADPGFLPQVRAALDETRIDPRHLAVDLPLSALVKDPITVHRVAHDLADLGVVVIADGVNGAAPASALQNLPVSALKVVVGNASHRTPADRRHSAEAAIELARTIGAISVAKSVETATDLRDLRDMGFDRAFGHVFSPAMPAASLEPLLDRHQPSGAGMLVGSRPN